MSVTFTAAGTRALSSDLDVGRLAEATRYVRQGVGMIFRETNLARGDMLEPVALNTGTNLASILGIEGGRVSCMLMGDDGTALDEVDRFQLEQLQLSAPTQRGRPQVYSLLSLSADDETTFIGVWPLADRDYILFAGGRRTPGTGEMQDADPVPLPEVYEDIPGDWARHRLFSIGADVDLELATFYKGLWDDGCKRIRGDLQRRSTRNRQVPGTWSNLSPAGPTFHRPGLF